MALGDHQSTFRRQWGQRRAWNISQVDGMYVFAVKQACEFAKEYALQNGAIVLQMDKYWYHGQSLSGARQERDDPIERVRKLILSHGLATEKELKDYEKEIRKEVVHVKERTMPDPSEVSANVNVIGDGDELSCYWKAAAVAGYAADTGAAAGGAVAVAGDVAVDTGAAAEGAADDDDAAAADDAVRATGAAAVVAAVVADAGASAMCAYT